MATTSKILTWQDHGVPEAEVQKALDIHDRLVAALLKFGGPLSKQVRDRESLSFEYPPAFIKVGKRGPKSVPYIRDCYLFLQNGVTARLTVSVPEPVALGVEKGSDFGVWYDFQVYCDGKDDWHKYSNMDIDLCGSSRHSWYMCEGLSTRGLDVLRSISENVPELAPVIALAEKDTPDADGWLVVDLREEAA